MASLYLPRKSARLHELRTKPRFDNCRKFASLDDNERAKRKGVRILVDCNCPHHVLAMDYLDYKLHRNLCNYHFRVSVERDDGQGKYHSIMYNHMMYRDTGFEQLKDLITLYATETTSSTVHVYVCRWLYSDYFKDGPCYRGDLNKQVHEIMWD